MPIIFSIKKKHKKENNVFKIDNISKYIDIIQNNTSYNSNSSNIYKNKSSLEKQIINYSIEENSITNMINKIPILDIVSTNSDIITYKTSNNKILIKKKNHLSSGAFGSVYNAEIINNTNQKSVLLNKFNNMTTRLKDITSINVIIKEQSIYFKNRNNTNKILTEYFIHLLLLHHKKLNRYIPNIYGIYKYKDNILYIMEKIKGITFEEFIKHSNAKNINNTTLYINQIYSVLKQITLILYLLQKYFNFVHGDLNPKNIMLIPTNKKYRTINNTKIETHGYIINILDFGFSCIHSTKPVINNIIVPKTTYNNLICNQKYIDLLFLIIRISSNKYKYNIPNNLKQLFRNNIFNLIKTCKLTRFQKEGWILEDSNKSIINSENKYTDLDLINKTKGTIEYKIIKKLVTIPNITTYSEIKFFYPKNIYNELVQIATLT